jgi:Carboxypeptidase regulatory-like domain
MRRTKNLPSSKSRAAQIAALAAVLLLGAVFSAAAGTVSGTVKNGTTNQPVPGVEVILLQLQGGMQPVATTKTDPSGHFTITDASLGAAPMLLRVPYKGVLYHQPVPPNTSTADVEVYEPTRDPHSFSVTTRAIILQPNGSQLTIGEEYTITNQTNPPVAYYLKEGTFEFHVPDGAELNQVSAWGSTGMPVIQGTIDKGKGIEAVDWPFRPGNNGVRVSYQMPYTGNHATFNAPAKYNVQQLILAVPPGIQVFSPGFTRAGTEQGFDIYTHDAVAANAPVTVSISGAATAPVPAAAGADTGSAAQNPDVNSRADGADTAANVTTLPPRLSNNVEYILVAGFAALFVLGVIFLWRRPAPQTSAAGAASATQADGSHAASSHPAPVRPASNSDRVVAQAAREAAHSLDELKEKLFRLELRHQAGTISAQDYARERESTQKILRDLLKG